MNWIIGKTVKFQYHTDLAEILKPILSEIKMLNWVISDIDFISQQEIPINYEKDFFVLTSQEFNKIVRSDTQFIWGVISGFSKDENIKIDENNFPFADGNDLIWENENFQIPNSVIEIIAVDSSYTIIKFKDGNLSTIFKNYFDEAIELEKFRS